MTARPSGGKAVMESRAHGDVEADDPLQALWRRLEYFATPPWAARAGGELIASLDPGVRSAWEPAAGGGHMAHGLGDYFEAGVFTSDIHDHGAGAQVIDFLAPRLPDLGVDWIITNPPYALAEDFVRTAWPIARRGVAIFARLAFLESVGRFDLFYGAQPLTTFAPFSERVPLVLGPWRPSASTATPSAWFLFAKADRPADRPADRLHPIPPGTKARLSRAEDLKRFAVAGDGPLFVGRPE